MCANFKPITLEQVKQLELPLVSFAYEEEVYPSSLYTTNFIGPLSYQAFSFLKLRALS